MKFLFLSLLLLVGCEDAVVQSGKARLFTNLTGSQENTTVVLNKTLGLKRNGYSEIDFNIESSAHGDMVMVSLFQRVIKDDNAGACVYAVAPDDPMDPSSIQRAGVFVMTAEGPGPDYAPVMLPSLLSVGTHTLGCEIFDSEGTKTKVRVYLDGVMTAEQEFEGLQRNGKFGFGGFSNNNNVSVGAYRFYPSKP